LLPASFLYEQNEFLVIAVLLALLLIATEIGFRRGRHIRSRVEDLARSQHSTLQAGVMGLLALLLAFTFSMSETRFETRKQLLVDESNAIGTAWLRSRMLPQPYGAEVAQLTRDYVDTRLDYYNTILNEEKLDAANLKSRQLRTELWSQATAAAAKNPQPVPAGMFISSLNDVFEVGAKRDAARDNHVPQPVLLFLFFVTILVVGLLGFGCGLGGHRNLSATATVCVLIALVIMVIMDLDRPRRGLITISQKPMLELRASLR
jgi:hypothetical protein